MKVCILGNARSGTTAIYSLLQEIMSDHFEDVRYAYEPFLWDKSVFNGKFRDLTDKFQYWDSTSVEGIYQHQKLPLFITDAYPDRRNEYLDQVLESGSQDANLLAKFIRANGRIRLLQKACPDMNYIFVIRNPVDSVNSVLTKFSYFGGEFHHDDYPRFIAGINVVYGLNFSADQFVTQGERETLFWYYMNRFALETLSLIKARFLVVCHQRYRADPGGVIHEVCDFLNCRPREKYNQTAAQKIGDLTGKMEISENELNLILPYWDKYLGLLNDFHIRGGGTLEKILEKYTVTDRLDFRGNKYYGKIPLIAMHDCLGMQKANLEKKGDGLC